MKPSSILLILLVATGLRSGAQLPASYAAQLQRTLDSLCQRYNVKGATAAVYVPDYGTWEGASGESHAGAPMSSAMALPLNSNTKTYVAAALLKLQETGRLDLDDTIGRWIRNKPNISGAATIRQLLNHTSGIYSYTDTLAFVDSLEADFSRVWQPEEMLQFVGRPLFKPGANWAYSNTNYVLAGMIIAQVTGKPVEQAIREILLTPQGLNSTWFYPQERPQAVVPHFWFSSAGGAVDGVSFGYTPEGFYSAANAAGALFATAKDNVLFWQQLSSGKILSPGSMAEWRRLVKLTGSIGYGLGMFQYTGVNGQVVYEHGGTGAGAINENLVDTASGVCISVLTNQETVDNDVLFNVLVMALHRVTMAPPTAVAALAPAPAWTLFPVPASLAVRIEGAPVAASGLRYVVRDMTGRTFRSGTVSGGAIAVDAFVDGSYWLELIADAGSLGIRRFEVRR